MTVGVRVGVLGWKMVAMLADSRVEWSVESLAA